MIKNQKSPKIIVAEVKMTRMIHNKAILVVEGVKDLRFWKVWKGIECELVCGEGKPNVEAGIAGLDSEGIGGVLGVVDDDYNAVLSHSAVSENVVSTDAHDLECLLCRSGAFRRVLTEFGDADKIERLEDREGMDVRSCLLRRAVVFGRLRAACMLIEFDVNVSAISVSRFVDRRTWNVDEEGLIGAVADGGSAGEEQLVRQSISRLAVIDSWYIARGHDLVALLRIGFQNVIGSISAGIGVEQIERVLRSGISREDFEATGMVERIREWELENVPYEIL